jgi:hypothetical protein
LKAEGIQPKVASLRLFFTILDQCATRLMGMQRRGARGLRERASARKKKERRQRQSKEVVKSKSKKDFSLNSFHMKERGLQRGMKSGSGKPTNGRKFSEMTRIPMCNIQPLVKSWQRVILSMTLYFKIHCRGILCRKNMGYHTTDPKIRTQGTVRVISRSRRNTTMEDSRRRRAQRTTERDTELYPGSWPSW